MELKYGRDDELEDDANRLLAGSVGENKRSIDRDAEKLAYEAGRIAFADLRYYDPCNDWNALDSAFAIQVAPADIEGIEPTICADDDNLRSRNPALRERKDLRRHVEDTDSWGSAREDIPLLGANEGPRKVCTSCGQPKGRRCFYAHPRTKDKLQSQCKSCQRS